MTKRKVTSTKRKVTSTITPSGRIIITVRERGRLGTTTVSLTRLELQRIVEKGVPK